MKRFVLLTVIGLLAVGTAQAADFSADAQPAAGPSGPSAPLSDAPVSFTQSTDPVTVGTGSVACSGDGGFTTTDNQFLRRFFLNADHGITLQLNVTDVTFGVESAADRNIGGRPINISLNLYSIANGAGFTYANMSSIGSSPVSLADGTSQVTVNQAVAGVIIDPIAEDLVVELRNPDFTAEYAFFPGSNSAGELQPSYLASASCALDDPATYGSIGFGTVHLVMTVNGDEQVVPTPTPEPPIVGEPVPSMNRFGIIVMIVLLVGVAVLVMWRRS